GSGFSPGSRTASDSDRTSSCRSARRNSRSSPGTRSFRPRSSRRSSFRTRGPCSSLLHLRRLAPQSYSFHHTFGVFDDTDEPVRSAAAMIRVSLLVLGVVLVAYGGLELFHAARTREPAQTSCAELIQAPPPTRWVRAEGCEIDYMSATWRETRGQIRELYFP